MADNKIQVLLEVDDKGTASLQRFGRTVAQTGKDGERSLAGMSAASSTLARNVATLAASYASLQGVRALIQIADQYTNLEGRLRLVTSSTAELAAVETQLYAVAQQTRVGYAETVELYTRLARATKDTGISQTELMSTVQAVNQALIVSGATTTEANAALIQFSQGMASGVLRGEELNSVMEQTPRIAQMIADGLGISTGQLREWGKEGKLTSDVVMPALLRSAEDVNREFGLMPTTVAQAGTVLANTLKSLVADANSGSGATAELAEAIVGVSTAVDANRENILGIFANIVTAAAAAGQAILNIANSVKGFAAVAAGALSIKDYFGMSAEEFREWDKNFGTVLGNLRDRVKETSATLKELREQDPDLVDEAALGRAEKAYYAATKELAAFEAKGKDVAAASKQVAAAQDTAAKATTTTTRAVNTAGAAKKALAKESTTAAKAAKDLAREEEALAREAEATGRAMIKAAADYRAATAELSENLRKSLGEQIREEYAATAAGYDAREKLAEEHAEWIKGLQDGLLRDIEAGIGDFVYNFLTGEFDSIGDLFDGLCKSILRAFANLIAEMVAKWAMSGLVGLFTGQGFSGFNVGALGLGQGGILSGIGSGTGTGTAALSQYGPYAAGYQFGPGAGTSAAVTGGQAAGAALGAAGGAYGLYSAASQASKGEAGVGTALQAGISAYALYKAYPTIAAYLSGLGGASTASTAASGITIAASDLTLIGPQTGGIGNAIAGGSGTAAAGGGAGAGLSTGAMVGGGAIMGIGALIAMGMGGKAQQEFYSPRYGNVPFNDYGHDDRQDMLRAGSAGYSWVSESQPGSMSGSGDAGITQTVADLEAAFVQFEQNTRIVLDVLAAAGDGVASLGQQLEDGKLSTDAFVDAIAGYDVSIQDTAHLTSLASQAAKGNGSAMDTLRAALQSMGMGADQAEVAALALVAASNNQSSALYAASTAASTAAGAVSGMVSNINTLSRTPLNIRVNVAVREQPYRIDNSNPYAEHAAGGIFAGPTLIPSIRGTRHLVGEAGAEAIMPLHAGPKTLEKMHEDIRALAARPLTTIINLDGRQIASATMPYVDAHVAAKATRGQLGRRTVY